jgi:hypothetical protein
MCVLLLDSIIYPFLSSRVILHGTVAAAMQNPCLKTSVKPRLAGEASPGSTVYLNDSRFTVAHEN